MNEFLWGLVLGAVLGVVAERLLGHPLDRYIIQPIRDRLRKRSATKMAKSTRVNGELIELSNGAIFVAQYTPSGFDWRNLHAIKLTNDTFKPQSIEDSILRSMGVSEVELSEALQAERLSLDSNPRTWNGQTLSIVSAYVGREARYEDPVLELQFALREYALCRALQGFWLGRDIETRRKLLSGDALRDVHPAISSGFGLNLTVETADGKLLVSRRGAHTIAWAGHLHTSMNEGLSSVDLLPGGEIDLRGAFERGLAEELGLRLGRENQDQLVVHSLILDTDRYEWGLLGHLDLRATGITSSHIRSMRNSGLAADDWEASEISFVSFTKESVLNLISDQGQWIPHGLVNVALSYLHRFPSATPEIISSLTGTK